MEISNPFRRLRQILLAAVALVASENSFAQSVPLFNGVDLDGWHAVGGSGSYHVDNGEIVGLSAPNSPNTFLVTDVDFADFILELDFKILDSEFNSGIQLRSHSLQSHNGGQLFGYQVEIDPSSRAWTGGLYFEGGSPQRPAGWLDDLDDNPSAQVAFVLGEWNHFRIAALGRRIATWINDIPAVDFVDTSNDAFLSTGIIGLQIHSNASQTPLEVRWRELMIEELLPGDFNKSGSLDLQDYLTLVGNMHTDVSAEDPVEAYRSGDINGDLQINFQDLVAFRNAYPGQMPELPIVEVPEPSALVLLLVFSSALSFYQRGRRVPKGIVFIGRKREALP